MQDRQVRCQVRKVITIIRGGMKLRHQPRHKDHPAYRKSKGSVATESEEDRVKATYLYRWKPQEQAVLTTSQA